MDDERAVFIEEVRERKAVAQSAKKRSGYTRYNESFKKPSEHWKVLRGKNGAVMEYKIGQPISWEEFKSYPKDMQQEWIDAFCERFQCGTPGMSILFGKPRTAISTHLHKLGLHVNMRSQFNEQKEKLIRDWMKENDVSAPKVEKEKRPPELPYFVDTLKQGELALAGPGNEIFQTLSQIFRNKNLKIHVAFELVAEEPEAVQE